MIKRSTKTKCFIVVAFILTQVPAIGYAQNVKGLVASSLGGAGVAAVEDGEQFLHNPATIAHASRFSSALFYQDNSWGHNDRDRYYGLTLSDNTEDLFAAGGFAYVRRERSLPDLTWSEHFYQASLGGSIVKYLTAGMALKLRNIDSSLTDGNEWNVDVGVHYNPREDFGAGLVFQNLLSESQDVPGQAQSKDAVALGFNWLYSTIFRVRGDVVHQLESNPNHLTEWGAGIETMWTRLWILRLGYMAQELHDRGFYSIGLGFDGPRLKADYFFRQDTQDDRFSSHGVDLRLPFW